MGEMGVAVREVGDLEGEHSGGENDKVIQHKEKEVESEIGVILPEGKIRSGENAGIDGGKTGGADEFHEVDGGSENDDARQSEQEAGAGDERAEAAENFLLTVPLRDVADARTGSPPSAQIGGSTDDGNGGNGKAHPENKADKENEVKPGGHKEEVDQGRGGNKGKAKNPHAAAAFKAKKKTD